jgi:hypothetical protein
MADVSAGAGKLDPKTLAWSGDIAPFDLTAVAVAWRADHDETFFNPAGTSGTDGDAGAPAANDNNCGTARRASPVREDHHHV